MAAQVGSDPLVSLRSAMVLYMYGVVGVFLLAVPWTPAWDQAMLAFLPSKIGGWLTSGWSRGLVSGIGALDLCAAAQEAGAVWRTLRRPRGTSPP